MTFKPKFLATGIGSMPFTDAERAAGVSLENFPEAPFWPQLPRLGLNEQMEIQYAEGLPCAIIEREKQRMYFDTSGDYSEAFAEFYEAYLAAAEPGRDPAEWQGLGISEQHAAGLYALKRRLEARGGQLPFVKVQATGPCTMGLSLVDEQKRAIYYNEEFRDMLVKAAAVKCLWQIREFRKFARQVICFIDEPILSGFGSSTYVSVKREDLVSILSEVTGAIHGAGALAGIHCCGNTEWSVPIEAGVDIVSFDAFGFGETIAMYHEAVAEHLARGGALAWGIVPTSAAVREQSAQSLAGRLEELMQHLAARGIPPELIAEQAVITPACGTGSLKPEEAELVFRMTGEVSALMRKRYSQAWAI